MEIVKAIIQKEADVDIADKYGRTPLSWAIRNGYSEVAKILLENKADPLLGHKSLFIIFSEAKQRKQERPFAG